MDNAFVLTLIQVVVPITMFTLMFGMGLTLTKSDFKRIVLYPKPVLVGLVLQLAIMPLIGFGLALHFELSIMLAVGLVALAATPGGTTSNVIVHMGKGDTALSITLTAIATSVTLLTLPIWVNFVLLQLGTDAYRIEMPILKTAVQLAIFTVIPVLVGMYVNSKYPKLKSYEPLISRISLVAMIAAFIGAAVADNGNALTNAGDVFLPTFLLLVSAIIIGFILPKSLGITAKESATIAVETCLKNILLSLFIATNSLKEPEASYASAIMGIIMIPAAIMIMVFFKYFNNKQTTFRN
ncbi:bile acid:sodium symporter family protein [Glaciecola petra]|uniref:Bile acid:sodium symporter n=1 Tax=Glaciecola petra TaxID=3075602 RepID=A0ABU2ZV09_9ALTE|nr:hypothetical protein [Aestuariibacter sp. P117]MDT0596474.1 hypothetical protein [Aestuariibacter sp. P117]